MQKGTIGKRIRHLRKASGISQQELAEKLYISQKTVSSWECGRTAPDSEMLLKLSAVFGTSLNYLFTGKERL